MGISSGTRRKDYLTYDDYNKYNEMIKICVQMNKDRTNKTIILNCQQYLGTNLNPDNMSSSELEYWSKKLNEDAERKFRERNQAMNDYLRKGSYNNYSNSYNNYNNGFYNNYKNNYYY